MVIPFSIDGYCLIQSSLWTITDLQWLSFLYKDRYLGYLDHFLPVMDTIPIVKMYLTFTMYQRTYIIKVM